MGDGALDYGEHSITLSATSTLEVNAVGAVPFGSLILKDGLLGTLGSSVRFSETMVHPEAGSSQVGFRAETTTFDIQEGRLVARATIDAADNPLEAGTVRVSGCHSRTGSTVSVTYWRRCHVARAAP